MDNKSSQSTGTKERILDHAEVLFSQKGFRAVGVREIVSAAGCNLSSINYHFSNKHNLYLEVFRSRWQPRTYKLYQLFNLKLNRHQTPTPDSIVECLAEAFLEGFTSMSERQRHLQLLTREMAQPSDTFELVVDEVIQPIFNELVNLLRPYMPSGIEDDLLKFKIVSLLIMVLHFNFSPRAITRITGQNYDDSFEPLLINHIINFSLNGLGLNGIGPVK